MAITTYAELQSAITNWLGGRSDIAAPRITECIALFEASANRRLRVYSMQTHTFLTTVSGSVALPSDFLAPIAVLQLLSQPALELRDDIWLSALFPTYPTGTARFYSLTESALTVYPQQDASFALSYYQKIPALSDSNTTNWLLTAHPDLYLFGSLVELELFLGDDNRAPLWLQRRDAIYDEIKRLSERQRFSAGTSIGVSQATP